MTVTEILQDWNAGDASALERLMPVVYSHLHQLAERRLRVEQSITLQPTELVHEVFLRLTELETPSFRDRVHFYGAAASLMRRILVDLSRRRSAQKREVTMIEVDVQDIPTAFAFDSLDAALTRLEQLDPQQARVVELRFFAGLSIAETAQALDVSASTVKRDWLVAKAWLLRELSS